MEISSCLHHVWRERHTSSNWEGQAADIEPGLWLACLNPLFAEQNKQKKRTYVVLFCLQICLVVPASVQGYITVKRQDNDVFRQTLIFSQSGRPGGQHQYKKGAKNWYKARAKLVQNSRGGGEKAKKKTA